MKQLTKLQSSFSLSANQLIIFCQRSSTSDGLGASCLNVLLKYVARPLKGEGAGGGGGGTNECARLS